MLDTKQTVVNALKLTNLPVYYEQNITDVSVPCITYLVMGDSVNKYGDTLGYSNVSYRIKLWGTSVEDMATYIEDIDEHLRNIGLKRTSYNEMADNELLIGVFGYEGQVREIFD